MKIVTVLFSLFLGALSAGPARAGTFRLDDGSVMVGDVVATDDSTLTIRTGSLGKVRIPKARLESYRDSVRHSSARIEKPVRDDPAGYALFFLPTAFTPPAQSWNFRDFELLFLNLGYSPTSSTVISAGALFPVTTEFQLLSLGFKQQLYKADGAALAAVGNMTLPLARGASGETLVNGNLVASWRSERGGFKDAVGFHAVLGYWLPSGEEGKAAVGLGAEMRLGARAKLIAEYYSPFLEDELSMLNIGIRLHGDRLSADIAGIRPLEGGSDILFFPLLIINYRF